MSERDISGHNTTLTRKRGTPWDRASSEPVDVGLVTREALVVARALRQKLHRDPTAQELAEALGIGIGAARKLVDNLAALPRLTPGMERCLVAVASLEQRLGTSPSTREVADEMSLSPTTARYHINKLARLGLVTPPRVRLVLAVTPWGRELLPPELPPNASASTRAKTPAKPGSVSSTTGARSGEGGDR